jgi:ribonuclease HII
MKWVVGIDEAGRGPLAGPVAVGIIRAPQDLDLLAAFPGLNDSKKLTEKRREAIFSLLEERVAAGEISYRVKLPSAQRIDTEGIAVAIRGAVADGLSELMPDASAGEVWLDGALRAPSHYEQQTVIGGDGIVPAIMLASVAAKVTRDRLMQQLAIEHPAYGFEKHKGYGTRAHLDAIREHGLCAIHRATFIHLDRIAA